jgi:hypothetical protein
LVRQKSNLLFNPGVKGFIDERRQTTGPYILSVEVSVVFAFPTGLSTRKSSRRGFQPLPGTVEVFIVALVQLYALAIKLFFDKEDLSLHLLDRFLHLPGWSLAQHGSKSFE